MQSQAIEAFVHALLDPAAAVPAGLRVNAGVRLDERFAIHRNNVHVGLVRALASRFPVCADFVGAEFFDAMARVHVSQSRPTHERLEEYGNDFADFVAAFEPAASLPCLPDLARLECLWTQSWGAAEAPAMSAAQLARFDARSLLRGRVIVHPAVRLLRSAFPIAGLWSLHQGANPDLSALCWQPEAVLLTRPQAQVRLRRLGDAAATFAAALIAGERIECAAHQGLAVQAEFDLGMTLAGLAQDGFMTEIRT